MMPLTEIDHLKQTVSEAWESPIADQVAAAWGYAPGTAKWWRSSASHVFVLPDPNGKKYLRFVPDAYLGAAAVGRVVDLMDRVEGAAVVRPVPSTAGTLTATILTTLGPMHAMVVEAAPGEALDVDDLTDDGAHAWGRALAAVHRAAAGLNVDLPEAFGELAEVPARFADDPALVKAAARLGERLAGLPREDSCFGAVHGDFELDNLAWEGDRATAFDFDEAAVSWYAADIAFALRDLIDSTGRIEAEQQGRFAAFIAGYRSVRPLDEAEVANLPLFAGAHAVCSLVRIDRALGVPGEEEAVWLVELRAHLSSIAAAHRKLAVAIADDL
jgi:Ser/Thr protein kinase RdoA (MazF antagonist)